jgi:hypothetical protein
LSQQFVNLVPVPCNPVNERLVNEGGDESQIGPGDLGSRVPVKSTSKNGKLSQNCLFMIGKKLPGIVDYSLHTAVSFRERFLFGLQKPDAALDFLNDLITFQDASPTCR